MKRQFLVVISMLPMILGSCGSTSEEETTDLEIKHIPNPVTAVFVEDAEKSTKFYKWSYRTEVINSTSAPLKVVSFGAFSLVGDEWTNINVTKEEFTGKDFINWYDAGDSIVDGWILPGNIAADDNSWSTSPWQVSNRVKWRYVAVDSLGREFVGEEEVLLVPYYKKKEYWEETELVDLVSIRGNVSDSSGTKLDDAQIRIVQFYRGFSSDPIDVTMVDSEGFFLIHAARSGLYKLYADAPGFEPIDLPVAVSGKADDITLELIMRPLGEESEAIFDDSSEYLGRVQSVDRMMRSEQESSAAAYKVYSSKHRDPTGFSYDWSAAESILAEYIESDPEEAVRKYAALMMAQVINSSGGVGDLRMDRLLSWLPPESYFWGGFPQLPSWICRKPGIGDPEERLMCFYKENPDRAVRAHALFNLTMHMKYTGNMKKAEEYFEIVKGEYSDVDGIAPFLDMIDPDFVSKISKGREVPYFSVKTMDGDRIITKDTYRGKYHLIHFWSTWCSPCKIDMKYLHEAFERFKDRDFHIVSISLDSNIEHVMVFRDELWPMPWDVAVETGGTKSPVGRDFEVRGIPKMILVGPEGKIVETGMSLRGDKLVPFLDKCINKDK